MREIGDDQIDFLVAHLLRRKPGHRHGRPTAGRFGVANERVQPVARHVLERIYRLIHIGADGAGSGAVQGMARQALRLVERKTGANGIGGGQCRIDIERGPALQWRRWLSSRFTWYGHCSLRIFATAAPVQTI